MLYNEKYIMRNFASKIKQKMLKVLKICSSNEANHMWLRGQPSEDWVKKKIKAIPFIS